MTDAILSPSAPTFKVMSRAEAKALGLKRYFTGKPCKRGHIAERDVSASRCLICLRQWDRNYYAADPEKAKAASRKWQAANPERVRENDRKRNASERRREWRRRAYAANPAPAIERVRKWVAENPERRRKIARKWAAAHPDSALIVTRNRRARLRSAEGRHTAADIADILRLQKRRCAWCRVKLGRGYHVDHIQPIVRGGSNDRCNLQVLCISCNSRKGAADPMEFAQRGGRLL